MITASQLYDHVSCPRRVDLDAHGEQAHRAKLSAFVRMLWERGAAHETATIAKLTGDVVRLGGLPADVRERETLLAMEAGADVVQGRKDHGGRSAGRS